MSSEEGADTNPSGQFELSRTRARRLHEWVLQVSGVHIVSGLALGAHKPTAASQAKCEEVPTHTQRRIMILGLTRDTAETDAESLLDSTLRNINLPINLNDYRSFKYWPMVNYSSKK